MQFDKLDPSLDRRGRDVVGFAKWAALAGQELLASSSELAPRYLSCAACSLDRRHRLVRVDRLGRGLTRQKTRECLERLERFGFARQPCRLGVVCRVGRAHSLSKRSRLCITLRTQNAKGVNLCLDWHFQNARPVTGLVGGGSSTLFPPDLVLRFLQISFHLAYQA